jgi:hypothetical protein
MAFWSKKSIAHFGQFDFFGFQRKIYVLDEGYSRNESCTHIYHPQSLTLQHLVFHYLCSLMFNILILMFDTSLPPVVWRRTHVLFTLFVFAYCRVQHTLCVFLFCCSSSGVPYFFEFLWIVHFLLSFRYSLAFI